jgi:hypothetical protein
MHGCDAAGYRRIDLLDLIGRQLAPSAYLDRERPSLDDRGDEKIAIHGGQCGLKAAEQEGDHADEEKDGGDREEFPTRPSGLPRDVHAGRGRMEIFVSLVAGEPQDAVPIRSAAGPATGKGKPAFVCIVSVAHLACLITS